jgi:hypothetical protein
MKKLPKGAIRVLSPKETEFGYRVIVAIQGLCAGGQEDEMHFGVEEIASRAAVSTDAVHAVLELLKAGHDPYGVRDYIDLNVYYTN